MAELPMVVCEERIANFVELKVDIVELRLPSELASGMQYRIVPHELRTRYLLVQLFPKILKPLEKHAWSCDDDLEVHEVAFEAEVLGNVN
jgi:hypothetical protein